jgi:hypothetical protein
MHIIQIISEILTVITYILSYFADKEKKKLDEHDAAPPPAPMPTTAPETDVQNSKAETAIQEI